MRRSIRGMRAGAIVGEPIENFGTASGAELRAARRRRCSRASACAPTQMRQLSARILRRPAPAPRHRARARPQPELIVGGRAGLGARRVGAGAGHQPDDGPAGGIRLSLPFHRARSRGGAAHQPPRRRDVSRPHRRARATSARCSPRRCIPTPRRCSRRCRQPVPDPRDPRKRIVLAGDVPSPHRRRPAAASIRAARTCSTAARWTHRN